MPVERDAAQEDPLRGRHIVLRPLVADDYSQLYEWAAGGLVPWQWQGRPIGPEGFQQTLWSGALAHLVICEPTSVKPIGLFTAYGANFHHQFCYVQMGLVPDVRGHGWPIEAGLLGINYLFLRHNFRKIYGEITSQQVGQYGSAIGPGFDVEGRLIDHLFVDGELCDMIIVSLTRATWEDQLRPVIRRLQSSTREETS